MPHHHAHASSKRQLWAALIMLVFASLEMLLAVISGFNPLLAGDALHNFADGVHLVLAAFTDYIADRGSRHWSVCRLPLVVGGVGIVAPAVLITAIAFFETSQLERLSRGQLYLTLVLALPGSQAFSVDVAAGEA